MNMVLFSFSSCGGGGFSFLPSSSPPPSSLLLKRGFCLWSCVIITFLLVNGIVSMNTLPGADFGPGYYIGGHGCPETGFLYWFLKGLNFWWLPVI